MKKVLLLSFLAIMLMSTFQSCETAKDGESEETQKSEQVEQTEKPKYDTNTWIGKSQMLLYKIKIGADYQDIIKEYENTTLENLANELDTEDKKFAFWTNTYNAYIQHVLSQNPDLYKDRDEFFKKEQVNIAGEMISFDKIEHGIIRSSTMKISLGYVPKLFPGEYERKLRTDKRDPRIHFVLNCGAKDCPPVYIFDAEGLDAKFDKVASQYLNSKSSYDKEINQVKTTPLFRWFIGDFDGKDGAKEMLQRYGVIPADVDVDDVEIEYIDYDWTLSLGDFG